LIGIAPDATLLAIRQTAQTFGPKDPEINANPEDVRRAGDINTLARAIVHAANLGAQVINISVTSCLRADLPQDQSLLAAAVRYAAIDKDAVIVTAAGNADAQGCNKQNPPTGGWDSVTTIATPAWFSDYVLTVSATDNAGVPAQGDGASLHGPWVGLAAPGADMVGLSMDGRVINGAVDQDNLHPLAGSSFAAALVGGIAALVRAKYPTLTAHQVINRLEATARRPADGRDNVVGYGVVDPVAALTWDVAPGDAFAPGVVRAPLTLPPSPPPPNPWPRRAAWIITACASLVLIVVRAAVKRRRGEGIE